MEQGIRIWERRGRKIKYHASLTCQQAPPLATPPQHTSNLAQPISEPLGTNPDPSPPSDLRPAHRYRARSSSIFQTPLSPTICSVTAERNYNFFFQVERGKESYRAIRSQQPEPGYFRFRRLKTGSGSMLGRWSQRLLRTMRSEAVGKSLWCAGAPRLGEGGEGRDCSCDAVSARERGGLGRGSVFSPWSSGSSVRSSQLGLATGRPLRSTIGVGRGRYHPVRKEARESSPGPSPPTQECGDTEPKSSPMLSHVQKMCIMGPCPAFLTRWLSVSNYRFISYLILCSFAACKVGIVYMCKLIWVTCQICFKNWKYEENNPINLIYLYKKKFLMTDDL